VLRSFRLANHRSFRDEHELLLMPSYDKTRPTVPVAGIFGANASGKSNLLDGLRFMASAVRDSYSRWYPGGRVPRRPFSLGTGAPDTPSVFVAEVLIDGVRHAYGFVVDDERVHEEWLYSYPRSRKRLLFDRTDDRVTFGSTVPDQRSAKFAVLADLTRPNALFLSLAAQVGIAELLPTYHWFAGSPAMLRFADVFAGRDPHAVEAKIAEMFDRDTANKALLTDLLVAADFGITDIQVERIYVDARTQRAANALAGLPLESWTELHYLDRVRLAHGAGGLLDLADESAGTRAWLSLMLPALDTLRTGATLVVDEIDTSLHPRLASRLVRLFQSEANPLGAQLLFTTHDATLLGTAFGDDVLYRDQVWFVEKDPDGASRLYPLTDFYPRKGENTERRYLVGSYGGVPVDSDLASLLVQGRREDVDANAS
jgi:uncharacterized protein